MNANGNHTLDNIVDQAELSDLQKRTKTWHVSAGVCLWQEIVSGFVTMDIATWRFCFFNNWFGVLSSDGECFEHSDFIIKS